MHYEASGFVTIAVMIAMFCAALYTDLTTGKIYNKLTLPAAGVGILANLIINGWHGLLMSLAGLGLVLFLSLVFAPLAGIGGGDRKLMMAVGALMGFQITIWAMLYSAIIGGVLSLAVMIWHRVTGETIRNMYTNIFVSSVTRKPVALTAGSRNIRIRYSPAIVVGSILALLFKF